MALIRLFGRGKSGKSGAGARSGVGAVDAVDISEALAGLTTASLSATWRCRHASGVSLAEGSVDFAERSSQAVVIRGKHTYEYVRHSSSVLRSEVLDEALVVKNAAESEEPQAEEDDDLEGSDGEFDESESDGADSDGEGEEADGDDEEEDDGGEEESEDGDEESDDEDDGDEESEDDEDGDESDDDGDEDEDEESEDGDDDEDDGEADAEADEDEEADEDGDEEGEYGDADGLTAEADNEGEPGESVASGDEKPKAAMAPRPAWNYFSDGDACGPHAYAEPDVLAKAALSVGTAQIGKPEEFNGVLHNAYTVTLKPKPTDGDKALARLARQLRDHGANVIVVTAFTNPDAPTDEDDDTDEEELDLEGGDGDDDVEEYEDFDDVVAAGGLGSHDDEDGGRHEPVDPAKRIVRLRIELPHWTPADDPGADHSVRIDLFDLGEPVQIESPGRSNATRRTLRSCADLALF